jgi:uncharacterized protein (TIGR03067 family)
MTGYGSRSFEESDIVHTNLLTGRVTIIPGRKAGKLTNSFRIDPTKSPKQIDGNFDIFDTPLRAIYSLENNVLTLAIPIVVQGENSKNEPRPTQFATEDSVGAYVVRLKRIHAIN